MPWAETEDRTLRVLVVDDDQDDFALLRDILSEIQSTRFEVEWASSYEAGRQAILQGRHDICFLDYRLGGQTGLDLLRAAIGAGCRTPLILLTGYGEHEVDLEAMRMGAADYLVKDQASPALIERSIRYSIHRSRARAELQEREEGFRRLLDSTFEGIVLHDSGGTILEANAAAAAIFGYEPREMVGTPLSRHCGEELGIGVEATGCRKDGSRVQLELSTKSYQHRGKPSLLTAIRDISARKQMEAQILMQDRLASIGLLASSLAHEIGTPLGVIRGRAEYLSLQSGEQPGVRKNADIIIAQIDRVSQLIHSLLNLARGERSSGASETLLNQTVSEVLELMAHELRRHSIEVRNEIRDDLPVRASAEAAPFHQVLLNLLVNSVHAIDTAVREGRPSGHFIRVSARDLGSEWSLSIEDTGCGISRPNMSNLFKPFFTTKDIGVGTGLGLATCYRIVESWGGRIRAESELGAGTTFTITLPKARLNS